MTYTEDKAANILVNLGGYVSTSTMTGAQVRKISDFEIEGSFNSVGRLWGGPEKIKIYFVLQFDQPMERLDSWKWEMKQTNINVLEAEDRSTPLRSEGWSYHDAPTAGVSAHYTVKKGDVQKV